MFRFFWESHIEKEVTFKQRDIVENYNKLADALKKLGMELKKLDKDGVCGGLVINYLFFAQEERLDEFYRYLLYLNSLTDEKLEELVKSLKHLDLDQKELVIMGEGGSLRFNKLLDFLRVISDAQRNQVAKSVNANWDRTSLVFATRENLENELKRVRIKDGKLMYVSLGRHVFAIEKTKKGFYIFEPNHIHLPRQLLKNEKEVSNHIIGNLDRSKYLPDDNANIFLAISFYSYGNEKRELDDLIHQFNDAITQFESEQKNVGLTRSIHEYRKGKMSRAELALRLHDQLEQESALPRALLKFDSALVAYLKVEGILQEQAEIKRLLDEKEGLTHGVAYHFSISSLHLAIESNQLLLTQQLIEKGANINLANKAGTTPLYLAAQHGQIEVVMMLLAKGAHFNQARLSDGTTPLFIAAQNGHTEIVKLLLEKGAEPNQKNKYGITPLYIAAQKGRTEVVDLLLDYNVNPNQGNNFGVTPLFVAASGGHTEVIQVLLNHVAPANANLATKRGISPLYIAAQQGHEAAVNALLKHGATLDTSIEASVEVLLGHAKKKGCLNEVSRLFQDGKDTLSHFTPLHAAVFFGHTKVAALLLEAGADIHLKAGEITPLDFARVMNNKDMIALLEAKLEIEQGKPNLSLG